MSVNTGWIELSSALKTMRSSWEEAKRDWNDAVRREFEDHHWKLLELQVLATLRAIDRLAPVIAKARQECT